MTASGKRVLAVAVRTKRIACVVFEDGIPVTWDAVGKKHKTPERAAEKLRSWIDEHKPDVLVSENPDTATRKGKRQIAVLKAFQAVGEELPLIHFIVERKRRFDNVYVEAAAFGEQFPDLAGLVPRPIKPWESEGHNVVCFEALALARDAGVIADTKSGS
ncbi:hypothetical protein [Aliiroseovarius sp.]|uniref:hypothetical protein n=1 Tax=Aliiroseovarius sp. TaxID=1872442 RepID=UPI003BAD461D